MVNLAETVISSPSCCRGSLLVGVSEPCKKPKGADGPNRPNDLCGCLRRDCLEHNRRRNRSWYVGARGVDLSGYQMAALESN